MPRTSEAAKLVPVIHQFRRPPIQAPRDTPLAVRQVFDEIAAQAPHLVEADSRLLASYAAACIFVERARVFADDDPAELQTWVTAVKTQASLARTLRLTPQARSDAKTVTRHLFGHEARRGVGGWELKLGRVLINEHQRMSAKWASENVCFTPGTGHAQARNLAAARRHRQTRRGRQCPLRHRQEAEGRIGERNDRCCGKYLRL
jgi:hypothetical protein